MVEGEQSEGMTPLLLDEQQWRDRLTKDQYRVLREQGTDPAFAGRFTHPGPQGTYLCVGCGAELFAATSQFDSGSGWPSFTAPIEDESITLREDRSHGMARVEVTCRRCGGHLGHVFDDGPGPTGQRWCINSTSLDLSSDGA